MSSQALTRWPIATALMALAYTHTAGGDFVSHDSRAFSARAALVEPQRPLDRVSLRNSSAIKIAKSPDGLFYVTALVNGTPVRFLVDTGANLVVLTPSDARRVGVEPSSATMSGNIDTAAGMSRMDRLRLERVSLASREATNVDAAVMRGGLKVSLLGVNMLSKLGVITISGDEIAVGGES